MLLVMVYMTNRLVESGENFFKMWELVNLIRDCELPFICRGDWNMPPEEMQKTEMMDGLHRRGDKAALGRGVHLLLWQQIVGLRTGPPRT